ncbi:hypothetical protein [Sporolituus thermophilus]|uniref:Capsular polysaccharide export protein n=1 Tax=Sporolituus thermophilus DSM 23256 TaxID=1123285 RepID=A0A1G7NCW8_9FIRM|nr:hypothetical protein [Sporolituus thermophilus]SDF71864.1 capsular polysaccharide export protein [Sporolituus thermophilus DSM 23256]
MEKIYKNVLIIIESYNRWRFFSRMLSSFEKLGLNVCFFTVCPSVKYFVKNNDAKIFYLNKGLKIDIKIDKYAYKNTLEFALQELSSISAQSLIELFYANLEEIYKSYKFDLILVYNGTTCLGTAAKLYGVRCNIKTLFFEISNLPNKMLVDSEGTNAFSKVFRDLSILNKFIVNDNDYIAWRNSFINAKLTSSNIPQTKFGKSKLKDYFYYMFDKLGYAFLVKEKRKYVSCYANKLFKAVRPNKVEYDNITDLKTIRYVFYPMQVSHDSQLVLHSDVDNIEAIKYASGLAKDMNAVLLVKPHPAEMDKDYIERIWRLKNAYNFYFTNMNTFALIKNALTVVTINSTVGLEAKILGAEVHTLGRAIYSRFSQEDVKKYILGYLVNINYFSQEPITVEQIKEILKRASL